MKLSEVTSVRSHLSSTCSHVCFLKKASYSKVCSLDQHFSYCQISVKVYAFSSENRLYVRVRCFKTKYTIWFLTEGSSQDHQIVSGTCENQVSGTFFHFAYPCVHTKTMEQHRERYVSGKETEKHKAAYAALTLMLPNQVQ